ncbi:MULTISPECIES: guanosine-5'-triphosphate,3'-diphosphate diphosphatase [Pseudoalteromonas]|uniref:Guanosine-5'-triphosphate,3'-diphosphate pyrophosphatase n=1 Tax=Pseudoalteromonas luteoviolacea (strain 2ta16) TaxID=1353533 RepID=V4JF10_PSEL2|nr:guanosine-5'-triphosphate,3'-diphosphate diphosphatase [Pseudoalteromonas luteoviolacea]ESP93617.1 Exopolyphosphatase [Pseudoalteromonas luteoviolacea 2ta16]KZN34504.1 hypothetical protein N483_25240 [Pseudoalteromonas luteoviolacea NCIMB 1944]
MGYNSPLNNVYAVIDLGSNSFHMLIAKHMAGGVHTIGRVKRKVRLAAGLNEQNVLSQEAMERGWECLSLFAERLQDIPAQNIKIVATATLRLAVNADEFKQRAQSILNHKIEIISGELEACTIYKGVAHTSACHGKQLVVDIGGASTEVVIGRGFDAEVYHSLNMGCVTYLEKFFKDDQLSEENFASAIAAAKNTIAPHVTAFQQVGWELAIGASGTVQAIQEIFSALGLDEYLSLDKLYDIKALASECKTIPQLDLPGLSEERRLVFVSGLAILIALFESLEIEYMGLAGGALREGVLYSMIEDLSVADIRKRTLNCFMARYHVDNLQAQRVYEISNGFLNQLQGYWSVDMRFGSDALKAASVMHEIGLLIDFKEYHLHSAYILNNSVMPGYTRAQKQLIAALVSCHRLDIDTDSFSTLGVNQHLAEVLIRLLRIGVILSMRRQDDVLPELFLTASEPETLTLTMPKTWLDEHPLMCSELEQEARYQEKCGWLLNVESE